MSMDKNRAWQLLTDMSFVRVAGTPEELKAAELIKAHCEAAGVPAVIEDFEIDTCEITKATLEVLEPEDHAFPVIGIGKTASTPDEGVVGAGGNTYWQQAFAALKLVNTAIPSNVLAPKGIFACPTETNGVLGRKDDGSSASVGNTYKGTHYGMNRYLSHKYVSSASSASRLERRKLSKVVKPSATCSIGDKWFYIGRTSGYAQVDLRAYNYLPGERHSGRWNYATLDGGVKSMKGYPCKGSSSDWKDWLWAPTQW